MVEPLITLAKTDTEARRRLAFARLRDAEVVTKLFDDLGPRFKARPGGYTRILHMMPRPGRRGADGADAAGGRAGCGQGRRRSPPRPEPDVGKRAEESCRQRARRQPAARQRKKAAAAA